MQDEKWIPLLSGRAFSTFTPEEYVEHVRSLYHKKVPRKTVKPKKEPKPFTWRLNPKGTICLTVKRKPKFLTEEEILTIIKESNCDSDQLRAKIVKSKIEIRAGEIEEASDRDEDNVLEVSNE